MLDTYKNEISFAWLDVLFAAVGYTVLITGEGEDFARMMLYIFPVFIACLKLKVQKDDIENSFVALNNLSLILCVVAVCVAMKNVHIAQVIMLIYPFRAATQVYYLEMKNKRENKQIQKRVGKTSTR